MSHREKAEQILANPGAGPYSPKITIGIALVHAVLAISEPKGQCASTIKLLAGRSEICTLDYGHPGWHDNGAKMRWEPKE